MNKFAEILAPFRKRRKAVEAYTKKYGVKDPFDVRHHYNYARAMEAGVVPKKWRTLPRQDKLLDILQMFSGKRKIFDPDTYMWPDKFKLPSHKIPPEKRR